jgi:exopolysaccharide production protein ExoZ
MFLRNIQILRGLAATWVVLFHAIALVEKLTQSSSPLIAFIGKYGYFGVDLFFFISGFVIYYATYGKNETAGSFLRRRLERIAPPYFLFMVAYVAFWLAMPTLFSKADITPELIFSSFFYVSFINHATPLITVGWTIEYEMFFYAITALAILVSERNFVRLPAYIAALVIIGSLGAHYTDNRAFLFVTNPILLEFAMGFMIARHFSTGQIERSTLAAVALAIVVVYFAEANYRMLYVSAPVALLVYGAVKYDAHLGLPKLLEKFLMELGNASYSIYLIQVFSLPLAGRLLVKLAPGISPTVLGLSAVALTLLLGWLFFRLIESRILHLLRERRRKRSAGGLRLSKIATPEAK